MFKYWNYIVIQFNNINKKNNLEENKKTVFDGSFFENGFSYYAIVDNNNHALRSSIMMTSLEATPEKILLNICKNAIVFGISATANYDTVIGNYALKEYLIPKLKKRYFELDEKENEVLKKQFNDSILYYNRIKINACPINSDNNYNESSWKSVFKKDDDCESIYNIINQTIPENGDPKNFLRNRYLRIGQVFKEFIVQKDIKSFLCMLNKFPNDEFELNKDVLQIIFDKISHGSALWDNSVVVLRSGNDYEIKKEELLNQLKLGEKKLVISTYATIGAGQNLQYEVLPDDVETIFINDYSKSKEKDFDAIYLDRPTNLIKQLSESNGEDDFTKYLTQLEYLKTSGELNRNEVRRLIEEGFGFHYYGIENNKIKSTEIDSSTNFATKVLVQAVGRLCRTNRKNKNVYIYYDDSISDVININTCKKNLLNPEFEALIQSIGNQNNSDTTAKRLSEEAIEKSDEALIKILNYVKEGWKGWNDNLIEEWKNIRYWVLQHPTLSREEYNNCDDLFQPFYIQLPQKIIKSGLQELETMKR